MFHNQIQIQKNVATVEKLADGYRVVLTIEKQDAGEITEKEAAAALTKLIPGMFTHTWTFGGSR